MPPNRPSKPDRKGQASMSDSVSPAMEFALRLGNHSDARRVPNAVLATTIFVAAEVMFFAALISAHTIARASAMAGLWLQKPRSTISKLRLHSVPRLYRCKVWNGFS